MKCCTLALPVRGTPNTQRYVAAQSGDFRKLMLFDFHSRKWRELARGGYTHSPVWSRDSRFIYYQDTLAGEEQPIHRVGMAGGKPEEVASRKQLLRSDISSYRLAGLDPNGAPVAVIVRRNADIYALDLDLPKQADEKVFWAVILGGGKNPTS